MYLCIMTSGARYFWLGSSRRDLRGFPRKVRRDMGQALYAAQQGETDPSAKQLRGVAGGPCLKSSPIMGAALGALSTRFVTRRPSTSCTPSRRNRKEILAHQRRTSTSFASGWPRPGESTEKGKSRM